MDLKEYSNTTGLPSVSQIVNRFVYLKAFKNHHQVRGRVVHQAISEDLNCGFPVIEVSEHRKYFESFLHFKPCVKHVITLERRFTHQEDQYTGQIDFLGEVKLPGHDKELVALIDWKTSQSASKTMPISLAGYNELIRFNQMPSPELRVNVLLDRLGGPPKIKIWPPENYVIHDTVWRSALHIHRYFGPQSGTQDDEII